MPDENRPQLILEVAFGVSNPLTVPASNQWTDISAYLRTDDLSIRRGRPDELSPYAAGTAVFTLENGDGRFDPLNNTSPYHPNVVPMRRVRLRAVWSNTAYTLFTGFAQAWTPTYDPLVGQAITTLRCTDMIGALLAHVPFNDVVVYDGPWGTTSDADLLGSFFNWQPPQGVFWGDRKVKVSVHAGGEAASGSLTIHGTTSAGVTTTDLVAWLTTSGDTSTTPQVLESNFAWREITRIRIRPRTVTSGNAGQAEIRVETSDYPSESSGDAAKRILDAVGVDANEREVLVPSTIVPNWSPGGSATAHSLLQRLATGEQGFYYVNAAGVVIFHGRSWRWLGGISPGITLSASTVPFSNLRLRYDEKFLYPVVRVARQGGTVQEARDSTLATTYGPRTLEINNLLIENDNEAAAYADALLYRYKHPRARIEQIELQGELARPGTWSALLAVDIGTFVRVATIPPGSVALDQNVFVEQIALTIRGNEWRWVWNTSPGDADLIDFWVLEVDALDSSARLAF